jgi:hypothetical protein
VLKALEAQLCLRSNKLRMTGGVDRSNEDDEVHFD